MDDDFTIKPYVYFGVEDIAGRRVTICIRGYSQDDVIVWGWVVLMDTGYCGGQSETGFALELEEAMVAAEESAERLVAM